MTDKYSIKEVSDLIVMVEKVAIAFVTAAKDGRLNLGDLRLLLDPQLLLAVKDGVAGVKEVDEELKELSAEEIVELKDKGLAAIQAIIAAAKG